MKVVVDASVAVKWFVAEEWTDESRRLLAQGQTVLDPFMGSGTTAVAAQRLNRYFIGFEAVEEFHAAANGRLRNGSRSAMHPSAQTKLI